MAKKHRVPPPPRPVQAPKRRVDTTQPSRPSVLLFAAAVAGLVPDSTVAELRSVYQQDSDGLIVTPFPRLGSRIALTAWTHLALCSRYEKKTFNAIRDAYRFHGPALFSRSALRPGM